ncbi:FAD-binding protein [Ketogulonicigenium robustum]|uniref:FAD-binding protein n=1 Tax=Ketogulonicigenium robustum TaxID=92947 RepID=UPI0012F4E5B3|nr:FAD-binding protein [Ketogulonicigenium robustum]
MRRDPNRIALEIFTVLGCHIWSPLWRALLVENRNGSETSPVSQHYRLTARRGVVLAAGGYDHNMPMPQQYQSSGPTHDLSSGAEGNTGDAITPGRAFDADLRLMAENWWSPEIKSNDGDYPAMLLAKLLPPWRHHRRPEKPRQLSACLID